MMADSATEENASYPPKEYLSTGKFQVSVIFVAKMAPHAYYVCKSSCIDCIDI